MKLSISCCWNSHRHEDGYEMVRELVDLGFEYIELSHGVRVTLVPGILQAVDEGLVKISSVHNFCPLPTGITFAAPNLYQPSAPRKVEHHLWFRNTLKTIDFANRVGADLMVIHSGSVPFMFWPPELKLEKMMEGRETPELAQDSAFVALRDKQVRRIRRKQKKFRKQLIRSYRAILPAAKEKGVRLGIENREGFTELPLDDEMRGLLAELGEPEWFGYWHDAGHAELKSRLGVFPHRQLLEENHERQFGFHLHDVSTSEKDHQPLGSGVIDWNMVRTYIKPEQILVLELNPRLKTSEVAQSRDFALTHFFD
jgi:sugar phosphate isomerase/epimerase